MQVGISRGGDSREVRLHLCMKSRAETSMCLVLSHTQGDAVTCVVVWAMDAVGGRSTGGQPGQAKE